MGDGWIRVTAAKRVANIIDAALISILLQFLFLISSAKFLDGGVIFANLKVIIPAWDSVLLVLLLVPAINCRRTVCRGLAVGGMVLCFVVAVSNPVGAGEKSGVGAAAGDIGAYNSALALYQADVQCKQYPTATLRQLVSDNEAGWAGPYIATITTDPWKNQYTYTSDGTDYTIQSIHDSAHDKSETIRYCFSTGVMESLP